MSTATEALDQLEAGAVIGTAATALARQVLLALAGPYESLILADGHGAAPTDEDRIAFVIKEKGRSPPRIRGLVFGALRLFLCADMGSAYLRAYRAEGIPFHLLRLTLLEVEASTFDARPPVTCTLRELLDGEARFLSSSILLRRVRL